MGKQQPNSSHISVQSVGHFLQQFLLIIWMMIFLTPSLLLNWYGMYDSGPHLLYEAKQSSATNSAGHDSFSKAAAITSPSLLCGERKRDSANAHSIKWQVARENLQKFLGKKPKSFKIS